MRTISVVATVSLFVTLGWSQDFARVSEKWSRDSRLSVPELNFSVTAPSKDARWTFSDLAVLAAQVPGPAAPATAFMTSDSSGTVSVVVIVYERSTGPLERISPEKRMKDLIAGASVGSPPGWSMSEIKVADSKIPLVGSARFTSRMDAPNSGKPVYQYGYIVPGRRTYYFLSYSTDQSEPTFFTDTVLSFRLINPSANIRPSR
jgi:hypothetical protein